MTRPGRRRPSLGHCRGPVHRDPAKPTGVANEGRSSATVYGLTFTTSEYSPDFEEGDITVKVGSTVVNQVISDFEAFGDPGNNNPTDDVNYTATLTLNAPTNGQLVEVSIANSDRAGNMTDGATITWTYDNAKPSVASITSNKVGVDSAGNLATNQTIHELTITLLREALLRDLPPGGRKRGELGQRFGPRFRFRARR